jgi:hypothetical protein
LGGMAFNQKGTQEAVVVLSSAWKISMDDDTRSLAWTLLIMAAGIDVVLIIHAIRLAWF